MEQGALQVALAEYAKAIVIAMTIVRVNCAVISEMVSTAFQVAAEVELEMSVTTIIAMTQNLVLLVIR